MFLFSKKNKKNFFCLFLFLLQSVKLNNRIFSQGIYFILISLGWCQICENERSLMFIFNPEVSILGKSKVTRHPDWTSATRASPRKT